MKARYCCYLLVVIVGLVQSLPSEKHVLDMSEAPQVAAKSIGSGRSVNISFFVPAFSLFRLATEMMPQFFPALTPTTISRGASGSASSSNVVNSRRVQRSVHQQQEAQAAKEEEQSWFEKFVQGGLVY